MNVIYWNSIKDKVMNGLPVNGFEKGSGISIGSFDGLHAGHRQLLSTLKKNCHDRNLMAGVISFTRPLPSYKHASDYQGDLTTLDQRLFAFAELGLDFVIFVDFDEDFSKIEGIVFLDLLKKSLNLKFIAEGLDFRCGYKGATDVSSIKMFADNNGVEYEFLDAVYYRPGTNEQERISSSYIRNMIKKRFFSTANELLMNPFTLSLNFSSSDMKIPLSEIPQVVPPAGIYRGKIFNSENSEFSEVRMEITDSELKIESVDSSYKIPLNQNIQVVL